MKVPTFDDVVAARALVSKHLPRTPLMLSWPLSRVLGCDYFAKCENLQPVGAFKIRGGVNLLGTLGDAERRAGIISASTGNHGQSLAFAGRLFGVRVVIYAPVEGANLGVQPFGRQDYRTMARIAFGESIGTDRGEAIVGAMVVHLRQNSILLPSAAVLEKIALVARARARKQAYKELTAGIDHAVRDKLDALIRVADDEARTRSLGCGNGPRRRFKRIVPGSSNGFNRS